MIIINNNNLLKVLMAILALILFTFSSDANAQGMMQNIGTMFANGNAAFESLIRLTKLSAYIMGLFLVIGSVVKLSQLGSNPQVTPKTPLVMFISGIAIFALVGVVSIVSQTMAMGDGPGSILVPESSGITAGTKAALEGVLTFVRLLGYIAFIRGWFLINQFGMGKDGTLGRGLTHVFGGVAAINVQITAAIISNTFFPGLNLPF